MSSCVPTKTITISNFTWQLITDIYEIPENWMSEALGALSDPELSGSGKKTSGIYPIFRTLYPFRCPTIFTIRQKITKPRASLNSL